MTCPLTVLLIMRNEEETLHRCLSSIMPLGAEVIIVDTGSTDNSIFIARSFTDRICYFEWTDDFSSARNYGLDQAAGDWILVLDGDEELAGDSQAALLHRLENPDIEAYCLTIQDCGENDAFFWPSSDMVLRLFRNRPGRRYRGAVYEEISIDPGDRVENAEDIVLIHYGCRGETLLSRSGRNLRILTLARTARPDDLSLYFHTGFEYYRLGQFQEARENLVHLWPFLDKQDAYAPKLIGCLSLCLHLQGFSVQALNFLEQYGLSIYPDNRKFHYIKGLICRKLGRYAQAYQSFLQIALSDEEFAHNGSIVQQKQSMLYHFLGNLSEYLADRETALAHYYRSLKLNPGLITSLKRMINILNPSLYPDYTVEALSRVFDLSDPGLQADLAGIFFEEGAYRLALNCLGNLSPSYMSGKLRILQSRCLLLEKRYDEAEQVLLQTAREYPFSRESRYLLVLNYWWTGKNPAALHVLQELRNIGDEDGSAVLACLIEGSKHQINFKVQAGPKKLAREIMHLLTGFADESSVILAWTRLETWMGPRPSRLLAEFLLNHQRFQEAEHEYTRCLEAGQDDALLYYYLAKSCWAMNQLTRAAQYMDRVCEKGLDTPKIRLEAARLYQELAVAALRQGLEHFPDADILDKTLQQSIAGLIDV